ncbi:MAG: histidine--tRNA ligase, partial [Legionellales bacterium]|nr:histidine--tRNA ligase [Legionellales bacterium]
VDYLTPHQAHFSEDESDRLARNPLRLLDTKSKILRDILDGAPKMSAYLSDESIDRHTLFKDQLHTLGIPYVENEHLVRGLDYYNDTVFEWTTECLGAQGTLCAGGRYDTLVAQLGGSPTPAIGCALGLERVLELLESEPIATEPSLIVLSESKAQPYVQSVARTIRSRYPQFRIGVDLKEGALKKQLKRAQQQQYTWALILETETHYRFKCLKTDITPIDGTLDTLNQQLDTLIFGT